MTIEWPRHLLKTKQLLVEGLKLLGFSHGKIGFRRNDDGTYTITLELPAPAPPLAKTSAPDEANSFRAMKRESQKR